MAIVNSNIHVFELVEARICESLSKYFPDWEPTELSLQRGIVETDYWSISYMLSILDANSFRHGIFVKIPKSDIYHSTVEQAVKDPKACLIAEEEFTSLRKIAHVDGWPVGCGTIRPLDYIAEFNAILTHQVEGRDLYLQCRRDALKCLLLLKKSTAMDSYLFHCGQWLHHFHHGSGRLRYCTTRTQDYFDEVREYERAIDEDCTDRQRFRNLMNTFCSIHIDEVTPLVPMCEGFEIRNILVDKNRTVYVVDPGRIREGHGMDDLAHFLVSISMLFWGGPLFVLRFRSLEKYRVCFLNGYFSSNQEIPFIKLLCWFEAKEVIRQWKEAYFILSYKNYPDFVREWMRRYYVDPFFFASLERFAMQFLDTKGTREGVGRA